MDIISWGEPPPRNRQHTRWAAIADKLRERPGEWALIGDDIALSTASHVRRGRTKAIDPKLFEVDTRPGAKRGRGSLYIRYVGLGPASAPKSGTIVVNISEPHPSTVPSTVAAAMAAQAMRGAV